MEGEAGMNRVCEILNIEKPVIQGPMAWISTAPLVAAVSNAGGLGVLGVGFAPEPFIREQIAETRKLTDKPFGMNVIMIPPNLEHVTKIVLDEKPPVMYADTIAGLDPELCKKYFDIWHSVGCKIVVKASFIDDAKIAADYTVKCIINTQGDADHWYGAKFETALRDLIDMLD